MGSEIIDFSEYEHVEVSAQAKRLVKSVENGEKRLGIKFDVFPFNIICDKGKLPKGELIGAIGSLVLIEDLFPETCHLVDDLRNRIGRAYQSDFRSFVSRNYPQHLDVVEDNWRALGCS